MPATTYDTAYARNSAKNYERHFVPIICRPVAEQLIAAADLRPGERVLDVACGTGIVTRLAAQRVGAQGSVAGLDPNPAMLSVARDVVPAELSVTWIPAPAENIPLELVAALDVSSSMTDALPRLKEAAKTFLDGLRSDDQVTLLAFNENIFMPARRSTDKVVRARAIDRMEPWGGTALYDVIIKAVELLGRQSGRRSIVLFSDGDDQSSHSPLEAAIARTEGSDATIYVIGRGRAVKAAELQALMNRLASVSGGRAFFTDDIGRLDGIFAEILEDLRNQYFLSYPTPSSQRDGAWHKIRVEVSGGRHNVRARQGYRLVKARMGAAVGLRVP